MKNFSQIMLKEVDKDLKKSQISTKLSKGPKGGHPPWSPQLQAQSK